MQQGKIRNRLVTPPETSVAGSLVTRGDRPGRDRYGVRRPTCAVITLLMPPRMLKSPTTSIQAGFTA